MKQATEHTWTVVFSGVDRSEMSRAFRGTQWQDTWYDRASRIDDGDDDQGMMVSIDVSSLTEFVALLKCCEAVRPSWGIQLCLSAGFGAVRFCASLCTKNGAYMEASASVNQTAAAVGSEVDDKLRQMDALVHDLRILVSAKAAVETDGE